MAERRGYPCVGLGVSAHDAEFVMHTNKERVIVFEHMQSKLELAIAGEEKAKWMIAA